MARLLTLVLLGSLGLPQRLPAQDTTRVLCDEGPRVAGLAPYTIPPPVFIRRWEAPRLMVFVHGLRGDGTASWMSRGDVYWPTLVARDVAFRDFDVFVHEYDVKTDGPIKLGEAVEEFVRVAFEQGFVSQYRDVVFVTEGDGVFYVRELLKRVRPFAGRASMIFVAGRSSETARPTKIDGVKFLEEGEYLSWRDFLRRDAATWSYMEKKPWTHCAVLGDARQLTVERDSGSAFCSTMPLTVIGDEWRALRPSCVDDPVHRALRRSVEQHSPADTRVKAAPATVEAVSSNPIPVPCQQTLERVIAVPIPFNPETEDLLFRVARVTYAVRLKAYSAVIQRVVGRQAFVRYVLIGLDAAPGDSFPSDSACPEGRGTIEVTIVKRPKG